MKKILLVSLLAIAGVSASVQNLIKSEKFATEVTNKVTNPNKATTGEWFIMNNEADGVTTTAWEQTGDAKYPNAMKIDNPSAEKNTSRYKVLLGQRITDGLEKGIYMLTFYAKAEGTGTPVSIYIKQTNEGKNDNGKLNTTFFMCRDYDVDTQPNASGVQYNFKIKDVGKWTKIVAYYDMKQVVNTVSSKKSSPALKVSDADDGAAILEDCYVAILGRNKGGVVEISDVTLKKK